MTSVKEGELELWVAYDIEDYIDQWGRIQKRYKWTKATKPVNLGSINKPNEEILQIRWIPRGSKFRDMK